MTSGHAPFEGEEEADKPFANLMGLSAKGYDYRTTDAHDDNPWEYD